jgi:hypothetical protein
MNTLADKTALAEFCLNFAGEFTGSANS